MKTSVWIILMIFFTPKLSSQGPTFIGLDDLTYNTIDSIIQGQMPQLTGLAIGIVYNGEVALTHSYGDRDDMGNPFNTFTKTVIASVSKLITGILTMRLVEENKLNLTTGITNYVSNGLYAGMDIRDLLTHQSGIPHYGNCPNPPGYDGPFDAGQSIDAVGACGVCMTPPGSGTLYSTFGSTLLGAIVDSIAETEYGKSYIELYEDWIQSPANLLDLNPAFDDSDPQLARGFDASGNLMSDGWSDLGWRLPAGGFISDIVDLTLFAKGILDNTFIERSTLDSMSSIQSPFGGATFNCASASTTNYGLAFVIGTSGGITRISHNGASDHGFAAHFMVYPDDNCAIVLIANERNEAARLSNIRRAIEPFILCPQNRSFETTVDWAKPDTFTTGQDIVFSTDAWNYSNNLVLDAGNHVRFLPGTTLTNRSVHAKTGGCNIR